jgi:spore coat polysaccharide biosynthesis protein SpsF
VQIIAIVQARMGSSRLPGKSLLPLWREMPLLELVLRRVLAARRIDQVVLATTENAADDELATLTEALALPVVRGPEEDVLARFALALDRHPADAVVRVCADNPFVDPGELDRLVAHFRQTRCDYATNTTEASGIPDGAGGEILAAATLRRAAAAADAPDEREHVTPYVTSRPGEFRVETVPPPEPPWPFLKLDVDTPDDYTRMRRLTERLPDEDAPLWPLATIVGAYAG